MFRLDQKMCSHRSLKKERSSDIVSAEFCSGKKWPPEMGRPVTSAAQSCHMPSGPPASSYQVSRPLPLAPQGERRAQDSATCAAILHIARKVDGHCRSVFLTDCVYRIGITERVDVSRSNLRRKTRLIRAPSSERIVHNYFRIRHDQPFGQRLWLSKERPGPESQGEPKIGAAERFVSWNNIEEGKTLDAIHVFERHPIGDTGPAIMASNTKAGKPLGLHHANHVKGHHALRIGRMIRPRRRLAARSIPSKISTNDGEFFRQSRRNAMPHHMRLRKAVQ